MSFAGVVGGTRLKSTALVVVLTLVFALLGRSLATAAYDRTPTISIKNVKITEGQSGMTKAVFDVVLSGGESGSVHFATVDRTATAGSDYRQASGVLTFSPDRTTRRIIVKVIGDTVDEPNETFTVKLSGASKAQIAQGSGRAKIVNDDSAGPLLSIGDVSVAEGNSGTTDAVFTVTLSPAGTEITTVAYGVADGSATVAGDYNPASGTLIFNAGETSKQITVQVSGDTTPEPNETFSVVLSNATNALIARGTGNGTITDDDGGAPTTGSTLSIGDVSVTEGSSGTTNAVFTVTFSSVSTESVTVAFATADGSATVAGDYNPGSGTLIFSPGETSKQITVQVRGDVVVEPDETFSVGLSDVSGATIVDGTGLGTILNDDGSGPTPWISIGDVNVTEGNSGTIPAVLDVTLSATSAASVTVNFTTTNGSAAVGSDFNPASGTLTFDPGDAVQSVTVLVNGDTTVESDETFSVTLSNPTNATIADGSGLATIANDDTAPGATPTISIGNVTVTEGNSGAIPAVFAVTLSAQTTNTVTVAYATANGSAAAPGDYVATSGTVTFNPGEVSKQIAVTVNGDTAIETNETFSVSLSSPTNATIAGSGLGTGTITDDDRPSISIGTVTVTEGNSGTVNAVFNVTLSTPTGGTVTVDYDTVNGSATAPADYQSTNGTLTFNPGEVSKQVTVLVNGDTVIEANETFSVNLSNPTNATIAGAGSGTGTITDDDRPSITITGVTVTEGNSGNTAAVFGLTLSAPSGNIVTVAYATANGSASAPADYTTISGTVTFNPGEVSKQIVVQARGDTLDETNETFSVNLSNPTNATIAGSGSATGTITDDDATPTLSIGNVTQVEGNAGTSNFVFTVTLSAASGLPVTVDFATANGTAIAPGDYLSTSGTLTFNPGTTTQTVTVQVVGDAVIEANETFTVVLSNATNATIAGSGVGTGTITNDD